MAGWAPPLLLSLNPPSFSRPNQPDLPHLHVTSQAGTAAITRKQHIPTGRVSLESVVRFAIAELGVRPIRDDWGRVLDAGQAAFDARRTW